MRRRAALLAAAAVAILPPAALGAPGSPDPTFADSGALIGPAGSASAVAVEPGGRIVVGGESYDGRGGHPLTLAAYSAGGGLDPGFGRFGVATAPATGLAGVAIAPDAGIVAVGYRTRGGRREPAVARFTPNGTLAGVEGGAVGDGDAVARAVAVARDGTVLVACDAVRAGEPVVAVVRFGPRGVGNTALIGLPGRAVTTAGIALGPTGGLTVAGTSYDPITATTDPVVARLLPDGRPDRRFGGGAPVVVRTGLASVQARAVALGAGGSVVVAGSGRAPLRSEFLAVRLTAAGATDATFGEGGVAAVPVGDGDAFATAVAIDPAGRTVMAGDASGGPALIRLGRDGALDPGFAPPRQLLPSPGSASSAAALAEDAARRLVVAGAVFAGDGLRLTLARYGNEG
ncbi:MAG: hypothetical protein QOC95_2158 [Thermoleophilaceae bacterium]|nr:hypothetical protein [Thermoleophilaceae bacterium]